MDAKELDDLAARAPIKWDGDEARAYDSNGEEIDTGFSFDSNEAAESWFELVNAYASMKADQALFAEVVKAADELRDPILIDDLTGLPGVTMTVCGVPFLVESWRKDIVAYDAARAKVKP
jgi:hypothetical protein